MAADKSMQPVQDDGRCWEIILLVDVQELMRDKSCPQEEFLQRLADQGIPLERRRLPVGDYMWVARRKRKHKRCKQQNNTVLLGGEDDKILIGEDDQEEEELVLDWIIERKTRRNVQFSLQLKSKMYPPLRQLQVQHYKLRFCQIPNRILLIENDDYTKRAGGSSTNHYPLNHRLINATIHTMKMKDPSLVVNYTSNVQRTIHYLVQLHHTIQRQVLIQLNNDDDDKKKKAMNINEQRGGDVSTNEEEMILGPHHHHHHHHHYPRRTLDLIQENIKNGFNDTKFQWYLLLKRIPKVSDDKIDILQTLYPTLQSMTDAFTNNPKATVEQIANITLADHGSSSSSSSKNNTRRKPTTATTATTTTTITANAVMEATTKKRKRFGTKLAEVIRLAVVAAAATVVPPSTKTAVGLVVLDGPKEMEYLNRNNSKGKTITQQKSLDSILSTKNRSCKGMVDNPITLLDYSSIDEDDDDDDENDQESLGLESLHSSGEGGTRKWPAQRNSTRRVNTGTNSIEEDTCDDADSSIDSSSVQLGLPMQVKQRPRMESYLRDGKSETQSPAATQRRIVSGIPLEAEIDHIAPVIRNQVVMPDGKRRKLDDCAKALPMENSYLIASKSGELTRKNTPKTRQLMIPEDNIIDLQDSSSDEDNTSMTPPCVVPAVTPPSEMSNRQTSTLVHNSERRPRALFLPKQVVGHSQVIDLIDADDNNDED